MVTPVIQSDKSVAEFEPPAGRHAVPNSGRMADSIYRCVLFVASATILAIVLAIAVELTIASKPSIHQFGLRFFVTDSWDPVHLKFGAMSFILGTLYTSMWALLISVPISIGAAVFLSEIAPSWIRTPVSFLIELLAGIPSVVYGLWGLFVLTPWLITHVETPISNDKHLNHLWLFNSPANGSDFLAASLILAIMVTPYITAVSRDILRAIPNMVREGSLALGATQWETIRNVVLPYARAGIVGAVILGLGRNHGRYHGDRKRRLALQSRPVQRGKHNGQHYRKRVRRGLDRSVSVGAYRDRSVPVSRHHAG
jgi:phosphate transport system permease protein